MKIDRRALRAAVRVAGVLAVIAFFAMDASLVRGIGIAFLVGLGVYWVERWDVAAWSPKQIAGLGVLILACWAGLIYIGRDESAGLFTWIVLAAIISIPAGLLGWSLLQWRAARRTERNGGYPRP